MNKLWLQIIIPVIAVIMVGGYLFLAEKKIKLPDDNNPVIEKEITVEEMVSDEKNIENVSAESIKTNESGASTAVVKNTVAQPLKNLEIAINDCRKSQDSASCFDKYFRDYLKISETKKILTELDKLQTKDANIRLFCHEIVHAIGRETFQKTGTVSDSFSACDQTCHSGCYHGAMERFLRGDTGAKFGTSDRTHVGEEEIKAKVVSACDNNDPVNFRFQCLHGLGHSIVYTLNYNLFKSLSWCDNLKGGWNQSSCWGGAFMENITASDKSKRFLSKTDYHFPCSVVEEKYKNDCYVMQTSRMFEMGLSVNQVIEECKKDSGQRLRCMQSLGRDKSNDARAGDPAEVSKICAMLAPLQNLEQSQNQEKELNQDSTASNNNTNQNFVTGLDAESDKESCTIGVSYALADNTWDGKYVFPFCESFEKEGDKEYCYKVSVNYLKTSLVVEKSKVLESCKSFVPASLICIEEASKLP